MKSSLEIDFYNQHRKSIHPLLKSDPQTKSLWRKLYWTTPKASKEYKVGCVEIIKAHFPKIFIELENLTIT